MEYQVIVGNVGTVYSGNDFKKARGAFSSYKVQSKGGYGRASNEQVTLMENGEIKREYSPPKAKLPTIKEIYPLVLAVKRDIADEYRAFEETDQPSIQLTVGWSDVTGGWSYQTGDNSYTGGAYGYPHWGVVGVYRTSNCREVAKDIIQQLGELSSQ